MRLAGWFLTALLLAAPGCGAGDDSPQREDRAETGTDAPPPEGPSPAQEDDPPESLSGPDSVVADLPRDESPPDPPVRAGGGRRGDVPPAGIGHSWARYRLTGGPDAIPRIDRLVLATTPADDGLWFDLRAASGSEPVITLSLLATSLDFLGGAPADPQRYLTRHGGKTIEWIDRRTGGALVPGTGLAPLLPRGQAGSPWPERLTFLGREFTRDPDGDAPTATGHDPQRRVSLDPDVQIGTSRHVRDDGTGMHDTGGKPARDYRYVELGSADYRDMIDAGMNVFRVPVSHLRWVLTEPAFVLTLGGYREIPDLPFRGSYLGAVMYMDEPAARCYVAGEFDRESDPARAAQGIIDWTRNWLASGEKYGSRHMAAKMTESGCDYGAIVQANYPVWEAVPSAAWYQLEAGMAGYCWEARLDPARLARESRENLGVEFPDDIDACIDFHVAVLRGAARRFDQPWGVSQYGQSVPAAADRLFPRAYDAGATYFWLWSTDAGHHFPHDRQLEVVRELRRHESAHPRTGTARELTAAGARTAIVLPWGYGFDDYFFGAASRHRDGQLWGSRRMRLDDRNGAGVAHRDVLAAAMREAVPLLESREPYDVLFLRDSERAEGYERVRRIALDAKVTAGP